MRYARLHGLSEPFPDARPLQHGRQRAAANERLFATCARLGHAEYRKPRQGSLGSIHGLLNHLILDDRIWMARFEGGGESTPNLSAVLFEEFADLRAARAAQDALIEAFFARLEPAYWERSFPYINNVGRHYVEAAPVAISHFFIIKRTTVARFMSC